jgi:hypothetical protein
MGWMLLGTAILLLAATTLLLIALLLLLVTSILLLTGLVETIGKFFALIWWLRSHDEQGSLRFG